MQLFSLRKQINRRTIASLAIASAVSVCLLVSHGQAQSNARFISSPNISIQPAAAIVDILKTGEDLERKGLWGDALTLYERATKDHNNSKQIEKKLFNARTHYDVLRRYSDPNFIKTVNSTHPGTAKNMLAELLMKIETHYVKNPEWVSLARQGLANLDVALFEQAFQNQHIKNRSEAQINYAFRRMHQIAQQFRVGTRQNNFDFAVAIANGLFQDLAIPQQATMFEFLNGATTSLDPYSAFLTGDQYADVMSQIDGNFVGLGVEIRPKKDSLQIMSVIPNGPAAKNGLQRGDFINSIEGKLISDIGGEAAADLLKGPAGSMITLQIDRNGQSLPFRIYRERVDIPSVQDVSIIDRQNGIGMIKLVNFQKTTVADFKRSMWQLHEQGMKSLIVDVRGNPGGLLTAAVDVADLFVTNGVLVSTKGRNPREDFIHQARVQGTWNNLPVTVLIDRDSASASEIFAGAISDLRRGTIVGETSYGKGSVQGIFPLQTARGGIRLTTAKFYSPSGTAISDRGVKPDIVVQTTMRPTYDLISNQTEIETTAPVDKALKAAISVAKQGLRRNAG